MIRAAWIPGGAARLTVSGGVSLLLHVAVVLALGPLPFERALTGALTGAMEMIDVTLVSVPAAAHRVMAAPAPPVRNLPVTSAGPARAATNPETPAETSYVEARHDVALLHNPRPPYPLAARRQGIEGKVVLRVQVQANGHCQNVQLAQSSGSTLLDEAALSTVRHWRFLPARQGGEPVTSWVEVPVKFQLRDGSRS